MGMLKIKVVDAFGKSLAGQAVNISGAGALQTGTEGVVQFLTESDVPLDIEINGVSAWSGNSAELAREELFEAVGEGFVRVHSG